VTVKHSNLLKVWVMERQTLPGQTGANQRQFVLDNNPPPDKRAAIGHGSRSPNRARPALVANPTASMTSPTGDPDGVGGSAADTNTKNHRTKNAASSFALRWNRRSQPRTVDGGRPSRSAIFRWPTPLTCSISAEPITSTLSRRRSRQLSGNNTWVISHDPHRDRRGRNRPSPSTSRIVRHRA
jgi:hypothetical protein